MPRVSVRAEGGGDEGSASLIHAQGNKRTRRANQLIAYIERETKTGTGNKMQAGAHSARRKQGCWQSCRRRKAGSSDSEEETRSESILRPYPLK